MIVELGVLGVLEILEIYSGADGFSLLHPIFSP
jgi:hypothetical protein